MYKLTHHKNLNPEIWSKYSTDKQILMIANELNRLMNGIKANLSFRELNFCMERIFELIDLTTSCQKGSLRKEILRWREIFAENYLLSEKQLKQSSEEIYKFYKVLLSLNRISAQLLPN